ncbi:hypothetical protein UL57_12365 [Shigella boydii]|nr:hypothetical protein UL57_12365 [Shigella boydii]
MNVPGGSIATTLATRPPGGKSPLARSPHFIPFGYRVRARGNIPVKRALSPHPCGLPRPTGNDSAIYSRTNTPAVMSVYHRQCFIAEVIRRYAASGNMTDTITPHTPSRHPCAAE